MLRKRMAELARISTAELDGQFGVQAVPARVVEAGGRRRAPSFVRQLLRLLVLRPQWACETDPSILTASVHAASPEVSAQEWEFLRQLLRLLQTDSKPLSLVEAFRGSDFQDLAGAIESEAAQKEQEAHSEDGMREELIGAWRRVLEEVAKVERQELELRWTSGQASAEDKERIRTLHRRSGMGVQP
jgi:hypothetical protein